MNTKPGIEYFWNLLDFSPNKQQKEAILHTEGPLYLPAGPGAGKTRVLLWRTFHLIVFHGVKPENIFLSTFTQKAARQLQEGLLTLLSYATDVLNKPFEINNMYIGTIHSLCRKLLQDRRFSSTRKRHRPPVVMDELSQFFYLYQGKGFKDVLFPEFPEGEPQAVWKRINGFFHKKSVSKYSAISNLISLFNRISEESPDLEEWGRKLKTLVDDDFKKDFIWLLELYRNYRNSLSGNPGRTDLSLLQQEAYRYLLESDLSGNVFDHVIIDEYQDTNMVQEYIIFTLAKGTRNICVVGDDDQALYRFRGATVENFVQFPERVKHYLGCEATRIPLGINYRSRKDIVTRYCGFMNQISWEPGDGHPDYRVRKNIRAFHAANGESVFRTGNDSIEDCVEEIADTVESLLHKGVVEDANRIAFLFSSLQSKAAGLFKDALENRGIKTYAPRAMSFLFNSEAMIVFGIITIIIGQYKPRFKTAEIEVFKQWHIDSMKVANIIIQNDPLAPAFIKQKQDEIENAKQDLVKLSGFISQRKVNLSDTATASILRELAGVHGLSPSCYKTLTGKALYESLMKSITKRNPFTVSYLISSATALDWTFLDLFYRICGLAHFKKIIDNSAADEGPLYNLAYVGQYINKYTEEFKSMITAFDLQQKRIVNSFFGSYLYTLFRREEKEFENEEDPFPKGRVPFLTIHQAKGLEFPVVVLGTFYKRNRVPEIDKNLDVLMEGKEPLELQPGFDAMRRLYVGMSRAENLLILNNAKRYVSADFKNFMQELPELTAMNTSEIPKAAAAPGELPKCYSFTGDFNFYSQCPMQYQIFRKFAFPPSRSQTMAFGALVHQTLEDLHEYLLSRKHG
ncbi:MAG: ATP-dependent helicase [Spirochaetales bacterium]|nr:ATP-dependent helicase [Spirochaetales bacterium]